MPAADALTGAEELELELPGAPFSLLEADDVDAAFALLMGVPPFIDVPAKRGIEGSIMPINVWTEGLEFLYRAELGLSNATERGSTISAGIYAIASVVIYPSDERVLYGCKYCITISD